MKNIPKIKTDNTRLHPLEENIINYLLNLSNENNLMEEKRAIEELRDSIEIHKNINA